ncbi:MAG: chemotaxis protein CheA [Planctomycetes bacterium]|nr:chemotaxis protein CheA [Planctomycetota bacterium]
MSDKEAPVRDEFFESLLGDFLDESGQLLDRLNEDLLQLDEWVRALDDDHQQSCDEELLNDMFRSAHSLKGLSAMLGLGDINNLTHRIENVFDAARKDELTISGDVVELMFQGVDQLVSLVDVLKVPDAEPIECQPVIDGISQLLREAGAERKQSSQEDAERALAGSDDLADESPEPPAQSGQDGPGLEAGGEAMPRVADAPPEPSIAEIDHFADLTDETGMATKYLSIFIDEADMSLDSLTETLLAMEGQGGTEAIETLLVTSHRIKGSAASVGLNRPAKLAHLMEDLLQEIRETGRELTPEVTDAMLQCTDGLRAYIEGLKKGNPVSENFPRLAHDLLTAQSSDAQSSHAQSSDAQSSDAQSSDAQSSDAQSSNTAPSTEDASPATPGKMEPPVGAAEIVPSATLTEAIREEIGRLAPEGLPTLAGMVVFRKDLALAGLKARLLYEKLSHLGQVCYLNPPVERLEESDDVERLTFGLASEESVDTIRRNLQIAGVAGLEVTRLVRGPSESAAKVKAPAPAPCTATKADTRVAKPRAAATPAKPGKSRPAEPSNKPTETLRVDIDRLDQLMNLAGQLVINRARFSRIGDALKNALASKQSAQVLGNVLGTLGKITEEPSGGSSQADPHIELENLRSHARRMQADLEVVRREIGMLGQVRGSVNDLLEGIHQLDRVTDGIQQSVMDTRMVPIGPLFTRFKRVVRDITRGNGKDIQLVIRGEKTELDKRMIDELGDPLIHMVRNSADHGIELPDVREAAGKPAQGTVTLDAFHRGNSIIIQVTDDGKGLDPDRILAKALSKGIISEADAEKMTPHEVLQLIWEPGLSTAEKVTEVSGRGMGMGIVRSKIEDISGAVDLESVLGQGTTFTIKLPLTLAILPSLMTKIDGDVFAIPVESVVEIVNVPSRDLSTVHGVATARVRGRIVSVVELDELLAWNRSGKQPPEGDTDETTLVILGDEGHEVGLAVDVLLGEEDIVIKSMAENYRNVAGIAGASILGDGRVSLILDVGALIEMSSKAYTPTAVS